MPLADAPHRIGDDSERLPAWQPWAALAAASLGLNFVWEMLQAPLYQGMLTMPLSGATRVCAQASAGDAVITLAAYALVAFAVRSRAWMTHPRVGHIAAYLATGLAVTISARVPERVWTRQVVLFGGHATRAGSRSRSAGTMDHRSHSHPLVHAPLSAAKMKS